MLEEQAPWSQLTKLRNIEVQEISDGHHRNEFTETFAFWIKGTKKKVLYIPDIDRWEQWSNDIYEACEEADICLLDGTFHSAKDLEMKDFHIAEEGMEFVL